MTVYEVKEKLLLFKQDLELYKAYWQKARGQHAIDLENKYQSIRKMIDNVQELLDTVETNISEEDFEC